MNKIKDRDINAELKPDRKPSISVQLFTVRKHMKGPDQIQRTLKRIREMGYRNVEVARVKFNLKEGQVIKEACDAYGIHIGSSQIKYKKIIKDFDEIVKLNHLWGCRYIGVSVLPPKYWTKGQAGLKAFAGLLNQLGKRLLEEDLNLLYHHHDMEFVRYGNQTGLEVLMEETDPRYVNLMMDTFWTQKGGRDPASQIDQFGQRIKIIHLRDYRMNFSLTKGYHIQDCPILEGNLDIDRIMEAARNGGVLYLPVEQATQHPFEDLQKSSQHLVEKGFL